MDGLKPAIDAARDMLGEQFARAFVSRCGLCALKMEDHPVDQCPYTYTPITSGGRVVGYGMKRK